MSGKSLIVLVIITFIILLHSLFYESYSSSFEETLEILAVQKAGQELDIEIAPRVKMKFCWIPAGKSTLGSPATEFGRFANEAEHEYQTKGFWMGKFEVTQSEWKALMGTNPSLFQLEGDGRKRVMELKIKDTSRFPVTDVSYEDCQAFIDRINKQKLQTTFNLQGEFCMPDEYDWEYACRGGRGNKQPFFWGKELNGSQANSDGNSPYGTKLKGPSLDHGCEVDYTNNGLYEKHPWGLYHMIGNVSEWCSSKVEDSPCVIRGGSWIGHTMCCRAACRSDVTLPSTSVIANGFRVCFRPS